MLASSSGIVHSLCFFLIGVRVWKLARQNGYTTQIEFFRDRLESDFVGLLLFPILIGLVIPYLLIGVISSGVGDSESLTSGIGAGVVSGALTVPMDRNQSRLPTAAIPQWLGKLVICSVVLIYMFFGGMRGTTWANTLQTIVFMVLGVVTFFVIATKLWQARQFFDNLQVLGRIRSRVDKLTRSPDEPDQVLHVSADPAFGRDVSPHLSALDDGQERQHVQDPRGLVTRCSS